MRIQSVRIQLTEQHFDSAIGINVPRSRFLPVKSCSSVWLFISQDVADQYQ